MTTINYETGLPYLAPSILSAYSHTAEPGPMTPDQMLEAWRQLLADGHSVAFEDAPSGPCCSITVYIDDRLCVDYERVDADPLKAFESTFRAYREAQERA